MPRGFASAKDRPRWSCMAYPRCEQMGCSAPFPISAWETSGGVYCLTLAIVPPAPHFCLGPNGGPGFGGSEDHDMDVVPISATRGVCQPVPRAYTNVNLVAHRSG